MNRIGTVLGYLWASLALLIVLATFIGSNFFSHQLVSLTGLTVSPWYTGGEVVRTIDHGTYQTLLHRPVFDGLFGERQTGFMQLNWESSAGLPPVIEEAIDYDGDQKRDFLIRLDTQTGKTSLLANLPTVTGVGATYKLKKGWAARVLLQKPEKAAR
jgi:hypothetical protein